MEQTEKPAASHAADAGSSPAGAASTRSHKLRVGDVCPRCGIGCVWETSAQHLGRNIWLIALGCDRCLLRVIKCGR